MSCLTGTEAPQSGWASSCDNSGPPPCSCLSSCMNWSVNQIIYPFTLTFSVADLESMGSLNLRMDPAKMTHKNRRKKTIKFHFWSAGYSLLWAEGFSYSFWYKKIKIKISGLLQFLVVKTLDPDSLEMLDADSDLRNPDPKLCPYDR